ncbi:MAG: ZIP family metal transporter [Gammaproteobacteria bacterium]|nr:MAG: ZIP family metal transporter [Gammaproteobacteria bacterium]
MHDSLIIWIFSASLLVGIVGVALVFSYASLPVFARLIRIPHFISFSIGSLLGAALLALLPHAIEEAGAEKVHVVGATVLIGILVFFILEKMVLWRHCHHEECEAHTEDQHGKGQAVGPLVLIGDSLHNFIHGVLIAASFLADIHLGVITTIAVAAHEIPQEMGNFVMLLHNGYSRNRALLINVFASSAGVVGALVAYHSLQGMHLFLPYILSIAVANCLYIAMADLLPTLHEHTEHQATAIQVGLILVGVLVIFLTHAQLH